MSPERPIGIDLFCGVGGLGLGFEQAGFDIAAAIEIDPIHAAVHAFNFPECKTIPESVSTLTGDRIREIANIGTKEIFTVFGGPPCQGFSLIGQRVLNDPRNSLVKEFVRLVDELQPCYFLFENVKGLTVGKQKIFLEELISTFEAIGYNIQKPWQVLNAANFGVPQYRERLFLLGARADKNLPEYPATITSVSNKPDRLQFMPPGPNCHDALSDLPDAENYPGLMESDSVTIENWGQPSEYARELRCLDLHAWHFGYQRDFNRDLLTSSARTNHTDISRRRFEATPVGSVEPISRFFKLPPDGPANTLRAGTDSSRGAFTSPRPIHYKYPRCITVREMARLQGFPDWFRFHKTKWHGARQVGNSVPPPLARSLASQILTASSMEATRPRRTLKLGDSDLLTMDMTRAAKYWSVPIPIAKRTRKSGARKRKQSEIESRC